VIFAYATDGQGKLVELYRFSNPPEQQAYVKLISTYNNSGITALKSKFIVTYTF
jgi:hypothetical protein